MHQYGNHATKAGKIKGIKLAKLAWCVPVSALFSFYLYASWSWNSDTHYACQYSVLSFRSEEAGCDHM